ncbi:MAG: CHAD domain-containing protein [Rhodospirillales bacterium]
MPLGQIKTKVDAVDDAGGLWHSPSGLTGRGGPVDAGDRLQLAVDAKVTARFGDAAAWNVGLKGDAIQRHLRTTYFDTGDGRLARRGLSLSVRADGRHYVQRLTFEGKTEDGAPAQHSWQSEIDGPKPQLEAITDPNLRERFGFLPPGTLKALFVLDFDRDERIVEVVEGGSASMIAVALDRGEIAAGEAVLPLREVELQRVQGSPLALYRLALSLLDQALLDQAEMAFEPRSRAARGFTLASGSPPPATKSFSIALEPEMSVEDGMVCILSGCLAHFLANQAAAADGRDPEGVHQFRVALRRLRSALTTFAPVLPPSQLARMQEEARWAIRSFNAARDWDVFLDELLPPVVGKGSAERFAGLEAGARAARAAAYDAARTMLRSSRYTRLVLDLGLWLNERGWRRESSGEASERLAEPIAGYAGVLLAKRHKTALKRGKGFDSQPSEARHQLRIALKKLRYLAEFFRSLYSGPPIEAYLAHLKSLQDTLGHLNDVATAERLIGEVIATGGSKQRSPEAMIGLATAGGRVLGWYGHGVERLEPSARRDWRDFKASEPFW